MHRTLAYTHLLLFHSMHLFRLLYPFFFVQTHIKWFEKWTKKSDNKFIRVPIVFLLLGLSRYMYNNTHFYTVPVNRDKDDQPKMCEKLIGCCQVNSNNYSGYIFVTFEVQLNICNIMENDNAWKNAKPNCMYFAGDRCTSSGWNEKKNLTREKRASETVTEKSTMEMSQTSVHTHTSLFANRNGGKSRMV